MKYFHQNQEWPNFLECKKPPVTRTLHRTLSTIIPYFFDWKYEQSQEVYKLNIVGSSDILRLVSVERIPEEWRIHIRLITVSKENKGGDQDYENIAGNLVRPQAIDRLITSCYYGLCSKTRHLFCDTSNNIHIRSINYGVYEQ